LQHITNICQVQKLVGVVLDAHCCRHATDEVLLAVAPQDTGQQSGFAQDLEAVADADNRFAHARECRYGIHDWRKTRDGSGAQVIAVRKATRQNQRVVGAQVSLFVPHERATMTQHIGDDVRTIALAVGARGKQ
jgi:hypothetical protein